MGYMIEITENKFDELIDNCEEMLRAGGKVMKCLDSMKRERTGNRMPMSDYRDKWDDDWNDEDRYGERRYYGRRVGVRY